MNESILKTIQFYCTNALEQFRKSKYFLEVLDLSKALGFFTESSFGEGVGAKENKYPKIIYLGIRVLDKLGETVVVDEIEWEHLSYATEIARIDKRGRITFSAWEKDEDFIETVVWIKEELQKKLEKQV